MKENVIKKLMTSMKCDACGQHYEMYDVDIIGHREDMWFLKVRCSVCQTQNLVAAVVREGKMPETPSSGAERTDRHDREALTADDVLSMRLFLADFDGNFSELFNQP